MYFYFLLFQWVKLFVLNEFNGIKGGVNGLKFFVEINLRDFPKGFFEGWKIYSSIIICIETPNFHLFVDRFRKYCRILFGNQHILNRSFFNPDNEMRELWIIVCRHILIGSSIEQDSISFVDYYPSHCLNLASLKALY